VSALCPRCVRCTCCVPVVPVASFVPFVSLTLCPLCPLWPVVCVVSILSAFCPLCPRPRRVHYVLSSASIVSLLSMLKTVVRCSARVFLHNEISHPSYRSVCGVHGCHGVVCAHVTSVYLLRPSFVCCLLCARCNLDVASVVCAVVGVASILSAACPLRTRRVRYI
jgi:hypothetical protein